MIEVQAREETEKKFKFGYLQVLHHQPTQIRLVASDDADYTRPESAGLSPAEQVSLEDQPIHGVIKLLNLSNSGVRLSDIQIVMDIDELERSMDYDVALVAPETGQVRLDVDHLEPGEDTTFEYRWIVTNKFGQIGQDSPVIFSIRPSYTVTMLAVGRGTQRDPTQDIGVAEVKVKA